MYPVEAALWGGLVDTESIVVQNPVPANSFVDRPRRRNFGTTQGVEKLTGAEIKYKDSLAR